MRNLRSWLGHRESVPGSVALLTIAIGLAALSGWIFGVRQLTSVVPGAVAMKANSAVGMISLGLALRILSGRCTPGPQRFAQGLCLLVLSIGLATVFEYCVGRTFGIDEWLVRDPSGAYDTFRGRMSPFTAAGFIAAAAALIALPYRRLRDLSLVGGACALLIGATVLLGYLWKADELITDRWLPPVALNTALCFALLGGGILRAPAQSAERNAAPHSALAAVELRILIAFVTALAILVMGSTYTYRTSVEFADSVAWVAHSQEVRTAVASIYGSLAGAEVAMRDYLLTQDDMNLREYRRNTADVQRHLDDVFRLTADNPLQQRHLAALRPIVMQRLDSMTSTLTGFADFGLAAARAVIAVARRSNAAHGVRELTDAMDAEELRLLTVREQASQRVRVTTLLSLLATLTLACGLFFALFRGIRTEMRARREAEEALRASERFSRGVVDSSPDGLCVLTLDGRVSHMSPNGMRLMGIDDMSRVAGTPWPDLWNSADHAAALTALDNARNGVDGHFQARGTTADGTPQWWDVIVSPLADETGRPERLLTVARDISHVKHNEEALRAANHFLDSLFEALPLMIFVKDARTLRYVRLNRECERMSGFTREQMIGKTVHDLVSHEEAAAVDKMDREVLATGRLIEIPDDKIQTPELGQRTRHTTKLPILDETGAARYLLGISEDVTARKLAETAIHELNGALELKARQLESSNRELESFSYSVSHDLRAPLRAIDGFAAMLAEDCGHSLDAEGRRFIAVIRENSKRMGALIDDLLQFSRLGRQPVANHDVDVDALVGEVIDEIKSGHTAGPDGMVKLGPHIEIGPLPPVKGDRGLLRQVWMNLLSNAIKYTGKAARPYIEVRGRRCGAENLYTVRDNGVGFDMTYADKLFGVFQRLHRADEFTGTGVGLAIVHRVVTRHGGRVWAEGRLNGGAQFSFALPVETP